MGTAITALTFRLEAATERFLAALEATPRLAAPLLVVLVLALHLPGLLALPPMDRTEVIYAQTAKQMNEGGAWSAPAFQAEPKFEKPLAVLWLQALSAKVTGAADQIRGYRIPSILGTILAVLFTYFGVRRVFDRRTALLGAAFLACMLVVTVQATLAMPEALMLATTCAAMWPLARMYVAGEGCEPGFAVALQFWVALGLGMLVNVATVPLIALLTVAALVIADRGRIGWLCRAAPPVGLIVMLAVASLWPLALWHAGTLDAAIAQWKAEGYHLLLGPQEMKWRVLPGLFVVFLFLGMFPAGLFLGPAVLTAWRERASPAIRFLVAWILPYLLFLEFFTRKTPLYMVQAMLPPLAVLFAVWVVRPGGDDHLHEQRWFRLGTLGWLVLVVALVVGMWALPFLIKSGIGPLAVVLGAIALAAAVAAAAAMLHGHRLAAASALLVAALAFNNLAIPVTFAGLRPVWVATEVRAAVDTLRACKPGMAAIAGFREPSAEFELGTGATTRENATYSVWSASEFAAWRQLNDFQRLSAPGAVACVAGYDFIHACSHRFTIFARGEPREFTRCPLPERFRCENVPNTPMLGRMCE